MGQFQQAVRQIVRPRLAAAVIAVLAVFKQVGWVAAAGAVIGLIVALGVGRLASSLLFELEGYDPLVFGGSVAVIALVALCASYLPARKASKVAPMQALRHE